MFGKKSLGEKIKSLFGIGKAKEEFLEDLEEMLLEADFGVLTTVEILDEIKKDIAQNKLKTEKEFKEQVERTIEKYVIPVELMPKKDTLSCYLFLGINGVGKTTSIAKLGNYYKKLGYKTMFAAGDTFRAAGGEQLKIHGDRLSIKTVSQETGSDPGAVIFDSIKSAEANLQNVLLCDTAGRMHNRDDLMRQLKKINKIIVEKFTLSGEYKKILVIDGNTGQNAIMQTEFFHEAIGIDAIFLSKFDSSSKAGVIVPIARKFNIPYCFMGLGEKYDNVTPFSVHEFCEKLLD